VRPKALGGCVGSAVVLLLTAPLLAGQGRADCTTSVDCASADSSPAPGARQLWAQAAQLHARKRAFVDAIRTFTEAQAGTFGDEGATLLTSVEAMRTALAQWDADLQRFEARARPGATDSDAALALATVYLERRRDADAIRELMSVADDQPGHADANAMLAIAYSLRGRGADALRALRRAASLDSRNPVFQYEIARLAFDQKNDEAAAAALRSVVRLLAGGDQGGSPPRVPFERVDLLAQNTATAPIFPVHRYAAGYALLDEGKYGDAVAAFGAAVAGDPIVESRSPAAAAIVDAAAAMRRGAPRAAIASIEGDSDAVPSAERQRVLGTAYWLAGDSNRSLELLRASIGLNAADDRARLVLALVLATNGRSTEAIRVLRDTIEACPQSGQAFHMLSTLLESESLAEAVAVRRRGGAQPPVVGRDAWFRRFATLQVERADLPGAVEAYRERIGVNPNSGEAHRQLAEIYFLQGRDDAALAEYTTAAWLDPADPRALTGGGQVYVRMQRYDDAVGVLRRATAIDGVPRDAHYALSVALARTGHGEDGRREMELFRTLQQASEADGQQAFALEAKRREAFAALAAGDTEQAIALFQEVAAERNDAQSLRELGAALVRGGRHAAAIESLLAAQRLQTSAEGYALLAAACRGAGNVAEADRHAALAAASAITARLQTLRDLTIR